MKRSHMVHEIAAEAVVEQTIMTVILNETEKDKRQFFSRYHSSQGLHGTPVTSYIPTKVAARPVLPFGTIATFDQFIAIHGYDYEWIPNPSKDHRVANEEVLLERIPRIQKRVREIKELEDQMPAYYRGMWSALAGHGILCNPFKSGLDYSAWNHGFNERNLVLAMQWFERNGLRLEDPYI